MNPQRPTARAILAAAAIAAIAHATNANANAPTPAPAQNTPFNLPLADNTTAQARLLSRDGTTAWLIYATKDGRLGLYILTPTTPPEPIPPPPPPTRPVRIAIVENPTTTTQPQRHVLAATTWRRAVLPPNELIGLIPNDTKTPQTGEPPPRLKPYITAAAGKPLPLIIFADANDTVISTHALPETLDLLLKLLKDHLCPPSTSPTPTPATKSSSAKPAYAPSNRYRSRDATAAAHAATAAPTYNPSLSTCP
jgi:hypothetical protein